MSVGCGVCVARGGGVFVSFSLDVGFHGSRHPLFCPLLNYFPYNAYNSAMLKL